MSVMEADEQDRGTVLHYAPRHLRLPADQRSIRPVLERLSRGDGDAQPDAQAEPARVEHPIPLEPPQRRIGWQLVACSILSAGLSAGLAVLAIGWLAPNKAEFTRIDAIQLDPKSVHTVSFKQDPPAAAPSESDLQKQPAESAPPIQPKEAPPPAKADTHAAQIAPKELLALWSGIPADVPPTPANVAAPVKADEVASAEAEVPPAQETTHRVSAHNRQPTHERRRHRYAHTVRPQTSGQGGQAATAAAQGASPAPLQSALQSLFGQSASGAQQAKQQPAPASPAPTDY